MVATTKPLIAIVLILCIVSQGASECDKSSLKISQDKTGSLKGGKTEWKVSLTNPCDCVFVDVVLTCDGFQTAEDIDPSVVKIVGDGTCLVNNGNPLPPRSSFTFNYASDLFSFTLKDAQVACS